MGTGHAISVQCRPPKRNQARPPSLSDGCGGGVDNYDRRLVLRRRVELELARPD